MTYLAKYSNLQMTQKYSERLQMIQINKVYRDNIQNATNTDQTIANSREPSDCFYLVLVMLRFLVHALRVGYVAQPF